ncbi:transmembrane protein 138-like [Achroia grisella]|uniref:LOW QUALITY PROTEIN: transmembrane protein 138-like n=1 Tax=Achroia grisella TaxID=688607 RepID=UPI0027D252D5|nr:LOW QUALITY PROTEIN: transmembrane protein 138-like [Achroia grisella]XP_059048829.1 transmembrane protein 138-like [Achroia grisella]
MKLSTPRYSFCLFFQLLFMFLDLLFNCISLFPRSRDGLLVLFIFQDLFLILSITAMLMTFFSTYLFQAGLVGVLVRRFGAWGAAAASYAAASVALHAAWLLHKWPRADAVSPPLLILLFTVHRCLSPWYYFFYKRAALRVSDPRFYEDMDWINHQLQTH